MLSRTLLASALLAVPASAQVASFILQGEVTSVVDNLGVFQNVQVGQAGSATLTVDLSERDILPAIEGLPAAAYPAVAFAVTLPEQTYAAQSTPFAIVQNNVPPFAPIDGFEAVDSFQVFGQPDLTALPVDAGNVIVRFEGDPAWFENLTLPNPSTIGLENALRAEVIIEFATVNLQFDEFGVPIPPDENDIVRSTVTLNVTEGFRGQTRIATIGVRAARIARPVAQADIFDLFEFLTALTANDATADFAAPFGELDIFDLFTFLEELDISSLN